MADACPRERLQQTKNEIRAMLKAMSTPADGTFVSYGSVNGIRALHIQVPDELVKQVKAGLPKTVDIDGRVFAIIVHGPLEVDLQADSKRV